jgi:hypothetical protein
LRAAIGAKSVLRPVVCAVHRRTGASKPVGDDERRSRRGLDEDDESWMKTLRPATPKAQRVAVASCDASDLA